MENASKALIMAAEVLIGIMILSFAVYIFTTFSKITASIESEINEQQILQFNTTYQEYEAKENISIYDAISIANLATQNNIEYEFDKRTLNDTQNSKDRYICVVLDNKSIEGAYDSDLKTLETSYQNIITTIINEITIDNLEMPKYEVEVFISDITKMVYRVDINQIKN